jgi:hypothetical protein
MEWLSWSIRAVCGWRCCITLAIALVVRAVVQAAPIVGGCRTGIAAKTSEYKTEFGEMMLGVWQNIIVVNYPINHVYGGSLVDVGVHRRQLDAAILFGAKEPRYADGDAADIGAPWLRAVLADTPHEGPNHQILSLGFTIVLERDRHPPSAVWSGVHEIQRRDTNKRAVLSFHDFGLLRVDRVLPIADTKQRTANGGSYDYSNYRSNLVKGAFCAVVIGIGVCCAAFCLMWMAYRQRTLYGQISLYVAGLIIALAAAPTSILVSHRLFFGNWVFCFHRALLLLSSPQGSPCPRRRASKGPSIGYVLHTRVS